MKKFQYITQNKLGSPISLAYGEQGKYSRAEESPGAVQKVLPQISVRFVDASLPSRAGPYFGRPSPPTGDGPGYLGPGACFLDYDNDGRIDVFVANNGAQGGMTLYHNVGNGKFVDVTAEAGFDPKNSVVGCTAGDYDNDGFEDLALGFLNGIKLYHNERDGKFKDVNEQLDVNQSRLELIESYGVRVYSLTFVDYDHDGDLDLYVGGARADCWHQRTQAEHVPTIEETEEAEKEKARSKPEIPSEDAPLGSCEPGNLVFRNNGDGSFTRVDLGLTGEYRSGSQGMGGLNAIGSDVNNDRAVDLVTAQVTLNPVVYLNPREGKFMPLKTPRAAQTGGAHGLAVLDFDHDGWMDIAFTQSGEPGLVLWRNVLGKDFEPVKLSQTNWVRSYGLAAIDYDNDGWVDLVAVGETKEGKGEVRLFRNLGPDGFKDVTAEVGLDKIQLKEPRAIIAGDYDNDGAVDLLITQNHGPAVLLRNEGGNKNNSLRLALKGLNDNKSAINSKFTDRRAISGRTRLISRSAWDRRRKPTSCACCGRPAFCRMKSKSLPTSGRSSSKSTAAAVRAPRCSHGTARTTRWSATCWALAWSGIGSVRMNETLRDRWSTSRLTEACFAKSMMPTFPKTGETWGTLCLIIPIHC